MLPVICLPGLMCTAAIYDELATGLGRRLDVRLPLDSDDFAAMVRNIGDELPKGVVLCGMSMGAYLALAVARAVPEKLRGLVLISGSAAADSEEAAALRGKVSSFARHKGVAALADAQAQALPAPGNRHRAEIRDQLLAMGREIGVETFARHQAALAGRPDQVAGLADIAIPTLVITGAEDSVTPPEQGRLIASQIPGARFVLIDGAGHLPLLEAPEAVAATLRPFLDNLAPETTT